MELQSTNVLKKFFSSAQKNAEEKNVCFKRIETNTPVELKEHSQIMIGENYFLNSYNPKIREALRTKDEITIGSSKDCDIVVPAFHDGVKKEHLKIFKNKASLFLRRLHSDGETKLISQDKIRPFYLGTKNINLGQENIGDCYLLSTIRALSQTDWGANAIKEMVQIDKNGNYIVTFKNKPPITVTIDELNGENDKILVSSELGVKAIERAYGKIAKNNFRESNTVFLNKGGLMDTALKTMTGLDSQYYSPKQNDIETILNNISAQGCNNYILTCGTINKGWMYTSINKKFFSGHAYTIKNIDNKNKTIEIINPHNTKKSQTISWNEFSENFSCLYVAKVPN